MNINTKQLQEISNKIRNNQLDKDQDLNILDSGLGRLGKDSSVGSVSNFICQRKRSI